MFLKLTIIDNLMKYEELDKYALLDVLKVEFVYKQHAKKGNANVVFLEKVGYLLFKSSQKIIISGFNPYVLRRYVSEPNAHQILKKLIDVIPLEDILSVAELKEVKQ